MPLTQKLDFSLFYSQFCLTVPDPVVLYLEFHQLQLLFELFRHYPKQIDVLVHILSNCFNSCLLVILCEFRLLQQ